MSKDAKIYVTAVSAPSKRWEPGKGMHTCNPSTQEAETGGSQVPGQPGLHSTICLQTKQNKNLKHNNRK
jgi:hypothetical protein